MLNGKRVTAKVKLVRKRKEFETQYTVLEFQPDYDDERNKEWAYATPALYLSMNVIPDIAKLFKEADKITLTLEGSDNEEHEESQSDSETTQ